MEKSRCRWEDFVRRVVVDLLHVQNWKVARRYTEGLRQKIGEAIQQFFIKLSTSPPAAEFLESGTLEILILRQVKKIVSSPEVLAIVFRSTICMVFPNACLLLHKILQLLAPGPSATLMETEEFQKIWKGTLMFVNQQLKEVCKWNTSLIVCTAQI